MTSLVSGAELTFHTALASIPVLGTAITPLDLTASVNLLKQLIASKARAYLCIANVHTTTLAIRHQRFRSALAGASAVVADGMPIVWCIRKAGFPDSGRVYGVDLLETMCASGVNMRLRHGFFGGWNGTAELMASRLKQRHAGLDIAGVWEPGLIKEGEQSPSDLLQAINNADCDVLWVGIGAPKQEIWMAQHRPYLRAPVMVGVGQAFDILAGRTSRAPDWMAAHGLEWLYRLAHDPRRLWKRYLVYNSLFAWHLFLEMYGSPSGRTKPEA